MRNWKFGYRQVVRHVDYPQTRGIVAGRWDGLEVECDEVAGQNWYAVSWEACKWEEFEEGFLGMEHEEQLVAVAE